MNYFDPDARLAARGRGRGCPNLRGGLVFVGVDGNSRYQFETDKNNVSPRLGGAFEIDGKTVRPRRLCAPLRSVLSAGQRHGRTVRVQDREPVVSPRSTASRRSGCCAIPTRRASSRPRARARACSPAAGGAIQAPLRNTSPTPWTRQWNVTLQRELPWRVARGGVLRRDGGTRSADQRRGRPQSQSARSAIHGARIGAEPDRAQSVLRRRQPGHPRRADDQPRPVAAPLSAVHRRHPAAEHRRRPRSTTRCS